MPASRFAEWAGACAKTRVTRVTSVTDAKSTYFTSDLKPSDEVTLARLPRVTRVTFTPPGAPEVTRVTCSLDVGLPENDRINQAGNTGYPRNPENERSANPERIAASWRDEFEERAAIRQFGGGYSRPEAEALAWGELENRWNLTHGERVSPEICAGCRRYIGPEAALGLMDGNWVHDDAGHACLIRHGARWRGAAKLALIAMGLRPPLARGGDISW